MPRLYRAELAVGLCGQERGAWSVRTVVSASSRPDWPGSRAAGPAMYSRRLRCRVRGNGHGGLVAGRFCVLAAVA
jgi:hypothetical protein